MTIQIHCSSLSRSLQGIYPAEMYRPRFENLIFKKVTSALSVLLLLTRAFEEQNFSGIAEM